MGFLKILSTHIRINNQITAPELRVIMEDGTNLGVVSFKVALDKARETGLDLIEISPKANPPVAKIMDYGKFQYAENKKLKVAKTKAHIVEVKNIQVKVGTGDHDLELKAKKASQWLKEGNRIKIDLFLPGRTKYMDMKFLQERMERVLKLITEEYKVADPAKKSPKGLSIIIERA
ncbi:MAG: translation initiation factor IF-3 [Minisyncoccia bacterium]